VKLILWIDRNDFSRKLFEKIFKDQGFQFYGLSKVDDFAYLISDLDPSLIIVDSDTALEEIEVFKSQYLSTQCFLGKPVIIIDLKPGLEFISPMAGEIKKPIDAFDLPKFLINTWQSKNGIG
jgi:hypothetical protein